MNTSLTAPQTRHLAETNPSTPRPNPTAALIRSAKRLTRQAANEFLRTAAPALLPAGAV